MPLEDDRALYNWFPAIVEYLVRPDGRGCKTTKDREREKDGGNAGKCYWLKSIAVGNAGALLTWPNPFSVGKGLAYDVTDIFLQKQTSLIISYFYV